MLFASFKMTAPTIFKSLILKGYLKIHLKQSEKTSISKHIGL